MNYGEQIMLGQRADSKPAEQTMEIEEQSMLNNFGDARPPNQTVPMESEDTYRAGNSWNQRSFEDKKAAVHQEMKRMNQLPVNSTYATHRLRVLNKLLQLMSIQRTTAQDEELEVLFATLSL